MKALGSQLFLRLGDEGDKGFLVVYGHVSQNLAVKLHSSLLQASHKLGVGNAIRAAQCIDTHNPECSVLALLFLAVEVRMTLSLLNSFPCSPVPDRACADIALAELQYLLVPSADRASTFNSRHREPPLSLEIRHKSLHVASVCALKNALLQHQFLLRHGLLAKLVAMVGAIRHDLASTGYLEPLGSSPACPDLGYFVFDSHVLLLSGSFHLGEHFFGWFHHH